MPHSMSFGNEYRPTTPVSIPNRKAFATSSNLDNITLLLEQTRIPRRSGKSNRKASTSSTATSWSSTRATPVTPARTPARQNSLFDSDPETPATSLPSAYSYLLTPPDSIPSLSRSLSANSLESDSSTPSPSPGSKLARISNPSRTEVDILTEDPLLDHSIDMRDEVQPPCSRLPPRRSSTIDLLIRPLKAAVPALRAVSVVSALSAHLSSWASSLAASQFDDGYGLLPSPGARHGSLNIPARGQYPGSEVPRPIKASGPPSVYATIIEAEMERPLLADTSQDVPFSVELQPWQSSTKQPSVPVMTRAREPRMNPDFLRILVLETNMRKTGKIAAGSGRARMILSPRCTTVHNSQLRTIHNI